MFFFRRPIEGSAEQFIRVSSGPEPPHQLQCLAQKVAILGADPPDTQQLGEGQRSFQVMGVARDPVDKLVPIGGLAV